MGIPVGPALKIDKEHGIIFRVKVLGRFSRNSHNLLEAENGTEYSLNCMKGSLKLYDNAKVKIDHPADRSKPGADRSVTSTLGVLRNPRVEADEKGEPAVWADLHYKRTHDMAPDIIEDVERRLGTYGLSHNAQAGRERFDPASKRLVIESLSNVRSVDLVDKPATNRNLWESEAVNKTLRELITARLPKIAKLPRRTRRATDLLEDDEMSDAMDAPVEAEAGSSDEDALWTGFAAAIQSIADQYKSGDLDAKTAGKKVMQYLKAHEGLTGEPDADVEEDEEPEEEGKKKDTDVQESVELATLRAKDKARDLCESMEFTPTPVQLKAITGMADEKERRSLIESLKGSTRPAGKPPRSGMPGGPAKKPGRDLTESKADPVADLDALRG